MSAWRNGDVERVCLSFVASGGSTSLPKDFGPADRVGVVQEDVVEVHFLEVGLEGGAV